MIDGFSRRIGRAVGWLILAMVLVQFGIVLLRHVFGLNSVQVQEGIIFMHGMVFMLAAAHVLAGDRHVRVDIFYAGASPRQKAVVNLLGSLLLLLPLVAVVGYYSWPYVLESWRIGEGSPDTGNMRIVYIQKTAILVFSVMMGLQAMAHGLRALGILRKNRG